VNPDGPSRYVVLRQAATDPLYLSDSAQTEAGHLISAKITTMPIELTTHETEEAIHSLKKYFTSELDSDLNDLRAKLLLDYVIKEIAPLAYNRGVAEAEEFFRKRLEDLPATCFEPPFTYWQVKRKKA
jgi:uncharacterized protein (DUF2164 family)